MDLPFPFGVVILMGISKSKIHSVIHNRVFLSRALAWDFDSPYLRWSAILSDIGVHWKVRRSTKGGFRQECRLSHLWRYYVTERRRRIHEKKWTGTIRILPDPRVVRTNCSKMIPKYDQTAFFTLRWDNPCPMISEVKKAQLDERKIRKMIPKRDHILLSWIRHRRDSRKEEL